MKNIRVYDSSSSVGKPIKCPVCSKMGELRQIHSILFRCFACTTDFLWNWQDRLYALPNGLTEKTEDINEKKMKVKNNKNKISAILSVLCGGAFCKKECKKRDAKCNLMESIELEIIVYFLKVIGKDDIEVIPNGIAANINKYKAELRKKIFEGK